MLKSVIENERYLAKRYIKQKGLSAQDITIVGSHKLTDYLLNALNACGAKAAVYSATDELRSLSGEVWYLLDAERYDPDDLQKAIALCPKDRQFLCIILLSNIKLNAVIRRYAEMELLTAMDEELGDIRKTLNGHNNIRAIVLDRLMGGEFDSIGLADLCQEAADNGTVTIADDMAMRYFSCLYIPDAVDAILTVSISGKGGNLYNATSYYMSEYQLRSAVYTLLARHGVKLKLSDTDKGASYAALDNGKLRSIGFENAIPFEDALRYTMTAHTSYDLIGDSICDGYNGKLETLRAIEKDMLREIDRICRKHDIKYFLSGGSMLGAVRHGGFIPWDDDIDVAMIRSEFVKFKSVVMDELDERFSYESYTNKDGYHFFFDRLSAKDTYFASKYSDGYEMAKGISVDIFVYDNVPDNPRAAYRHWKRLMNKRLVMNVRWKDTPRKGKQYMLSKIVLPILRLRSMDSYSASYNKSTRRYEHKSTSHVMPPATDHKFREVMPREWYTEVVPCRFEDVDTFLPVGYDNFLRIWYGEDYMSLLPLAQQNPYHDYYRLDLGSHIEPESELHFSYHGELK